MGALAGALAPLAAHAKFFTDSDHLQIVGDDSLDDQRLTTIGIFSLGHKHALPLHNLADVSKAGLVMASCRWLSR